MQLNKLLIEPRERSGWAAIDLGFLLAKHFWWRAVVLYLILATPVFIVLHLALDKESWLPFLVLWWLKPLFERPILFFLSRELFSESMGIKPTLAHIRQWLFPGLGRILITRRISLARSLYAPITLLERETLDGYNHRAQLIGSTVSSTATWLTVVLLHIESFLALAVLALALTFWPAAYEHLISWFEGDYSYQIYIDVIGLFCVVAIAPFYAAAGFMMYISRRIELEAWDIEICFRDWAREIDSDRGRVRTKLGTADA